MKLKQYEVRYHWCFLPGDKTMAEIICTFKDDDGGDNKLNIIVIENGVEVDRREHFRLHKEHSKCYIGNYHNDHHHNYGDNL